jgi:pimeloyl-ACP methyl ester carboxylesterase
MAGRLHALMSTLGYTRYGVQGGDWGAAVGTALALQQPAAVAALHLNVGFGSARSSSEPSEAEREYLEQRRQWEREETAYSTLQGTRPQTLGYALHDSPVGLLAWILEKLWAWSDHGDDLWDTFDRDQVLTNVMLYWLTGRTTSAARIYYEARHATEPYIGPRVDVPTGYASFPKELFRPPRDVLERWYNLVHFAELPRGGHFAAMEQPELFAGEVIKFFSAQLIGGASAQHRGT